MKTIWIAPMLPINMRYSDWWNIMFEDQLNRLLEESGSETRARLLFYPKTVNTVWENKDAFLVDLLKHESGLISWVLSKTYSKQIDKERGDILLALDGITPGLLGAFLKTCNPFKQTFCFCHGSSFNNLDIFDNSRQWLDTALLKAFDQVFVASEYHMYKLANHNIQNTTNLNGLPYNPFIPDIETQSLSFRPRGSICIVDRNCEQKRTADVICQLSSYLQFKIVDLHGTTKSWEEYYKRISEFRYMLITTKEETYGYQVQDAQVMGTIPICPHAFAFPEHVLSEFLYVVDQNPIATTENIISLMRGIEESILKISECGEDTSSSTLYNSNIRSIQNRHFFERLLSHMIGGLP